MRRTITLAMIVGGIALMLLGYLGSAPWGAKTVASSDPRFALAPTVFVVGVMLVTEGGHMAHLSLFGHHVTAMTKATFYFVLIVLVATDIVQSRYQKRLLAQRQSH